MCFQRKKKGGRNHQHGYHSPSKKKSQRSIHLPLLPPLSTCLSSYLATAPQLAPSTIDRRPSSRQPDTPSPDGPRAEHWCVSAPPSASRTVQGRARGGETNLNISGTMKNLTCEPRMYTWSRCDTRPSRAVTVMSFSCTFMLSSAGTQSATVEGEGGGRRRDIIPSISFPRKIWPEVSSSVQTWP